MPPSELHYELTRRVRGWMRRRATGAGFEWASEVYLAQGYVADAVVIGSFQHRFWLEVTHSSLPEWRERGSMTPEPEKLVIVFETKVSRSDFLSTFHSGREGNRATPIGNLHYLIIPDGLQCVDHLPGWWGILQKSGNGLRQVRAASFCDATDAQLHHAAFRVLFARARNPRCFICLGQTEEIA